MSNPSALVVNTAFLSYNVGDQITDPTIIAQILSGPYRNDVTAISGGGSSPSTPGLTLAVGSAIVGAALVLRGNAVNYTPTALDYSIDGGTTWSPVGGFSISSGLWMGSGPTYQSAQSGSIIVRDHTTTTTESSPVNFTVTLPQSSGYIEDVVIGTVSTLSSGSTATASATVSSGTLTLNFGIPEGQTGGSVPNASLLGGSAGGSYVSVVLDPSLTLSAGGTLAATFGTTTGSVADGGALATETGRAESAESTLTAAQAVQAGSITALGTSITGALANTAAAQATANAALPSSGGTMTGPVAFSGSGTVSAGMNLYMAPTNQLWLGSNSGTGAVYSATIANTTSNPGTAAVAKVWNNGSVLSLAGASAPSPVFAPAFVASQFFADIVGSSGIFPHATYPTPPSPRSGLLQGDRWKARGIFSAADFVAPSGSTSISGTSYDNDVWPALQALLLYVQGAYLAATGTGLANIINRTFFDVHLPAGNYAISQPLIVPRFVRLGGPGTIKPTPYVNPQSGTLTSGIFDGTVNASTNFLPLVVCASQSHLSDLNLYPSGYTGAYTYKTSGLVIGKNWQATGVSSIGSAGTGYSVGQVYLLATPDIAPFSAIFITVTAVNGSGGITGATVLYQGAYSLPPSAAMYNGAAGLQETQWASLGVFDPAVPHALLVASQASGLGAGGAPGSGASIIPTWRPDFANLSYYSTGSVSVPSGTTAGRITIHSAVQNNYVNVTYGPTYCVQISGLECEIESIRGLGGRAGLWAVNCQDLRINKLNFVDTSTFVWARYFGSIECPNCVIDTCGQAFVLDQGHGAIFKFRAFFEEGNIVNPLPTCNTGYTGSVSPGAISIGYGSTTTAPVVCSRLEGTLNNMGGLPASTISAYGLTGVSATQQTALVSIANAIDCYLDVQGSNYSQYAASGGGPTASPLPASALYSLGVNVDPGCVLKGSLDTLVVIDGVAVNAAIVTRTSGGAIPCEVDVTDTYHQTRIRSRGICTIDQSGAPVNGTTGAGQAAVGSSYINTANGTIYRNTGSLASPTWTTP